MRTSEDLDPDAILADVELRRRERDAVDPLRVDVKQFMTSKQLSRVVDNCQDHTLTLRAQKELAVQRQLRREAEDRKRAKEFAQTHAEALNLSFSNLGTVFGGSPAKDTAVPAAPPNALVRKAGSSFRVPHQSPPSPPPPIVTLTPTKPSQPAVKSGVVPLVPVALSTDELEHSHSSIASSSADTATSTTASSLRPHSHHHHHSSSTASLVLSPSGIRLTQLSSMVALFERDESYARASVMEKEHWRRVINAKLMNGDFLAHIMEPLIDELLHRSEPNGRHEISDAEFAERNASLEVYHRELLATLRLLRRTSMRSIMAAQVSSSSSDEDSGDDHDDELLVANATLVLSTRDLPTPEASLGHGRSSQRPFSGAFVVTIDLSPMLLDERRGRDGVRRAETSERMQLRERCAAHAADALRRRHRREHLERCAAWAWKHDRELRADEVERENRVELASVEGAESAERDAIIDRWHDELVDVVWGSVAVQQRGLLRVEQRMRDVAMSAENTGARGIVCVSESLRRRLIEDDWRRIVPAGMGTLWLVLMRRYRVELVDLHLDLTEDEEAEERAQIAADEGTARAHDLSLIPLLKKLHQPRIEAVEKELRESA